MGPLFFAVGAFTSLYATFSSVEGACRFGDDMINKFVSLPTSIQFAHPKGGRNVANGLATITFKNKDERTLWYEYTLVLLKTTNAVFDRNFQQPEQIPVELLFPVHQYLYTWHRGIMPDASAYAQAIGQMMAKGLAALDDKDKTTVANVFAMLNHLESEGRVT